MTTILVTGGAGYIGTHTDVELLNKGYDVVCVDNYSNSSPKALDRVEEITGKTVKRYEGDVRDEALMDRIFTENDIDWVIHFASLKSVGESVAKPIEYYDNNLNSTIVLLKAMRAHDVKKVIFSSSATVYGTPKELPLTEESQIGGLDRRHPALLQPGRRPRVRPDRRGSEGHSGKPDPLHRQGCTRRAQGGSGVR